MGRAFAAEASENHGQKQGGPEQTNEGRACREVDFVGEIQGENAGAGGDDPTNCQADSEVFAEKCRADSRNDQVGEGEQDSTDLDEAGNDNAEEAVENKIPKPEAEALGSGFLRMK